MYFIMSRQQCLLCLTILLVTFFTSIPTVSSNQSLSLIETELNILNEEEIGLMEWMEENKVIPVDPMKTVTQRKEGISIDSAPGTM